jgi:hypothetical protein
LFFPCVFVSGNANNGANAGFGYANTNNAPSNANANIGTQLCYVVFFQEERPCHLAKNNNVQNGVGSESEDSK